MKNSRIGLAAADLIREHARVEDGQRVSEGTIEPVVVELVGVAGQHEAESARLQRL